jgi:hypothetical protein
MRITELRCWVEGTYPLVYWLAGFTYPADFLTAVLQTTARRNLIPIDTLVWEFTTIYKDEMDIVEEPKEGIFVKGLYLEGAGWDPVNDCLTVCSSTKFSTHTHTQHTHTHTYFVVEQWVEMVDYPISVKL